jgi:hypothetical protein
MRRIRNSRVKRPPESSGVGEPCPRSSLPLPRRLAWSRKRPRKKRARLIARGVQSPVTTRSSQRRKEATRSKMKKRMEKIRRKRMMLTKQKTMKKKMKKNKRMIMKKMTKNTKDHQGWEIMVARA